MPQGRPGRKFCDPDIRLLDYIFRSISTTIPPNDFFQPNSVAAVDVGQRLFI